MKNLVYIVFCFFLSLALLGSCARLSKTEYNETIVIPFTIEGRNRIVLYATVNGVEGRFMWDTGAFGEHTLSAASLEGLTPVSRIRIRSPRAYYIENGIVVDGQVIRSKSIITYFPSHTNPRMAAIAEYLLYNDFDGILGITLFNGWWVEVSFSTNNIILHRTKPQGFTDYAPARTTFRGLYRNVNGRFFVPGTVDGVPVDFMLDTGLPSSFRFPHSIRGYLGTNDYHRIFSHHGRGYFEIRTSSINILNNVFLDETINTTGMVQRVAEREGRLLALLGMDFLQRYDLLFDLTTLRNRRGKTRLYFRERLEFDTSEPAIISPLVPNPSGIRLRLCCCEETIYVWRVAIPGFAHDELGIAPGMTITAINGQAITGADQIRLYEFLAYLKDGGIGDLTVLNTDGTERVIPSQETECEIAKGLTGLWILENTANLQRVRRGVVMPDFALFSNGTGGSSVGRFTWQLTSNGNILVFNDTKFDIEMSENGTLLTFFYTGRDYTGRRPVKAMYRRR